ncbi:hypothetical protein DID88_008041 [Monilinia fructigena]|uniref:Uncharacterized protein n=1 Tax=Monilinia fructigena TaxID=38457 RepID=A0A395J467_9HELO|nr:hypothetical protein DID88_008041 [Monilinia fructigena]
MSYGRPHSRGYFELDRQGHERVFFRSNSRSRRSTPQPHITGHEMANEMEERNAELHAVKESLRTELAVMEGRNWQLISDNSALREIIRALKADKEALSMEGAEKEEVILYLQEKIDSLAGKRDKAEVRGERAEERVRMMRRGFTGRGILSEGGLKQRLEDKVMEVKELEELIRVKDRQISERNRWLAAKDNKLNFVKRCDGIGILVSCASSFFRISNRETVASFAVGR